MTVRAATWDFGSGEPWIFAPARTRILGILNVTPDSFSDGGRYGNDAGAAIARGLEMAAEGADAIDVGGESTRPGSDPVPEDEEMRRVAPVVRGLRRSLEEWSGPHAAGGRVRISVDTSKARVAAAAIDAGADIVNDVTGLRGDPEMAPLLARTRSAVVLMHMRGTPRTMQAAPRYTDVIEEVAAELRACVQSARKAGIEDDRIAVDPGIGFGKSADHNLEILARLPRLASLERPILIGVSRKSFLGSLTGQPVEQRLEASLAAGAAAVMNGASILRVHDVAQTAHMIRVLDAVSAAGNRSR